MDYLGYNNFSQLPEIYRVKKRSTNFRDMTLLIIARLKLIYTPPSMFQYEMNEAKVKLRRVKAADVKSIIELLTQLDRPLPKDRFETKNFQKLIKSYIQNNSTNDNRGIILATTSSKIIGLVSFVLLERLNQPLREFWIPELIVSKEYRGQGTGKITNSEV